ncbi:ABC transporter permease subunit [Streptomyces sp. NPDC054765]
MTTINAGENTLPVEPRPPAGRRADQKLTQARTLRSEWFKFWSLRSSYYTLGGMLLFMIGFGVFIGALGSSQWEKMTPSDRASFDLTSTSLGGYALAQMVVGVLGVLLVTGEYSTGMIRSSLVAVPKRLPVLIAKAGSFAAIVMTVTTAAALIAVFVARGLFAVHDVQVTPFASATWRMVLGAGLYLTVIGLLGVGLGFIIRNTPGALTALFGLLYIVPVIGNLLPRSWAEHMVPYLPTKAGAQIMAAHADPAMLGPWTGLAVCCIYGAAALVIGAVLLKHKDA